MNFTTNNVVKCAEFADAKPILRPGHTSQSLDTAFAELHGLVSQMGFQSLSDHRAVVRLHTPQVLHGFGREKDLITHSSQMIA